MTTEETGITDIDSAIDAMISPEITGEEVEDDQETDEDATTTEDDEDHSEETEEDAETEEDDSDESEESEDESDTEEDEEDSEESTATLHTVTVDGEERQVDLDELKRGYSGQQYVQKGMQQNAAAMKQAEEVFVQLQNERQQIAHVAQLIQSGQLTSPPQEPDKAILETDPIGYITAKEKYDQEMVEYHAKNDVLQKQLQEQSAAEQRSRDEYLNQQAMQLKAVEPDFNNPEKAQVIRGVMSKYGQEVYGYTPEEIGAIADHRAIRVLHHAALWQELQASKGKTLKKTVKNVAKRTKRKSSKTTTGESRRRKQRDRLKKTGSIDDALELMMG